MVIKTNPEYIIGNFTQRHKRDFVLTKVCARSLLSCFKISLCLEIDAFE